MKKTLVAVAALVATGAFAEVTIGGAVNQVFTQQVDQKLIGTTSSTTTSIGRRGGATGDSFLTISGAEDLGDGLKASFKVEPRMNINGADNAQLIGENREAWLGLSGAFGAVNIGNNYTPLFLNAVAPFDPNGSTNSVGYLVSNITTFNATSSVSYTAPKLVDGLGIQVNTNVGNAQTGAGDSTGWGLSYSAGALNLGLAGEITKNTALSDGLANVAAASATDDLSKLGYSASYNFGMASVMAQVLTAKLGGASINTVGYGVVVPFGAFSAKLGMSSMTDKTAAGVETKYVANQISGNYAFSKRTSAYLLNSNTTNSTAATKLRITSLGVVHNF